MITVTPIPAYTDNYLWLIEHSNGDAVIVDPGDAAPVLAVLKEKKLTLIAIIITHRHWDHVDGINDLLQYYHVPVYGPDSDAIPQITNKRGEGDKVSFFDQPSLELTILEVPGHTVEHIAYFGDIDNRPTLFCGDTLFAGGCGRLKGGTHEQLCHSLQRISQLPEETQIFCTHEYTLANLQFAKTVEPDNQTIQERLKNEQTKRRQNQPTLPTSLALEQQTNPFIRCNQSSVANSINQYWKSNWVTTQELFTGLRRWKDEF